MKGIINRLKRVTNGKLRLKFSLFVANSEFETSTALVWCLIKKCLSGSCESTCADYFKKIRILFYINNNRTCTILIQTLTKQRNIGFFRTCFKKDVLAKEKVQMLMSLSSTLSLHE